MIRTFMKTTGNCWNEAVVIDTETNDFHLFHYEIIDGKLLKFSEHTTKNDAKMWLKERCKQLKYIEVENDFLDAYTLWNPETDNETINTSKGDTEMNNIILEIKSNGSKWLGQEPDDIETLLNVLETQTLDPTFSDYGDFITEYKPLKITDNNKHLLGCTSFFGNFATYSHVFNIITNDTTIIEQLTLAIRLNQQTQEYKEARAEYIANKKVKEVAQNKFYNKEIDMKAMYEFPITEQGKELYENYKAEALV